jgi:uridine kinase
MMRRKRTKAIVIGIAGGSGSGKTTFANKLVNSLEDVTLIKIDDYYKDISGLTAVGLKLVNFDHPGAIEFDLLEAHIDSLKNGGAILKPIYDYVHHERIGKEKVEPKAIILIEGLFTLGYKELLKHLNFKIFIDTPAGIRFIRRIERDIRERGRSVESIIRQYLDNVRPAYDKYIEPTKAVADIIINGEATNKGVINKITNMINDRLNIR